MVSSSKLDSFFFEERDSNRLNSKEITISSMYIYIYKTDTGGAERKKDRMNGGGEHFPDAQGCVERRGPRGRKSGIGWIKAVPR